MTLYKNPILPGFYPDPSIIRVGEIFYLINSSFQVFPGLPIHTSTDLINWKLIGHAVNRPSQLSLENATTKVDRLDAKAVYTGGLYAPTIRYHDGVFYIVCTNLTGGAAMRSDEDFQPQNFIISSTDLYNPKAFSNPIPFEFFGIDPSLLFDDDGKVYMSGSFIYGYTKRPATVIRQAQIDLATGKLLTEPRDIWGGSGDIVPEGPHLYKKDGQYWLMIAEGGTHDGHKVTMARSEDVWGPYESYERNPLITHREGSEITCVGHAELVDDTEGNWWALMLARRDFGASYPMGRETFMVPVTWPVGEFPLFEAVELEQKLADRKIAVKSSSAVDHQVTLSSLHTVYLRDPNLQDYTRGKDGQSIVLRLRQEQLNAAGGNPTFVGQRQTSLASIARVEVDLAVIPGSGNAGLTVYKDPFRHLSVDIDLEERRVCLAVRYLGQDFAFLHATAIPAAEAIKLQIQSTAEQYEFSYSTLTHNQWSGLTILGSVPCEHMSGDDFTGTFYGIYGYGPPANIKFNSFSIHQER